MARGRPTKYDVKHCDVVLRLMKKGLSKEDIAGKLGISRDTLYQWCKTHSEFSDTIKKGETAAEAYWSKILHESAIGKRPNANATVLIFIMKARFHWRDKPPFKEDPLDALLAESEIPEGEQQTETERIGRLFVKYSKELEIAAKNEDLKINKHQKN